MLSKTQAQGRIRRQMIEQQTAIPIWGDTSVGVLPKDAQHTVNELMENIQNKLADRMMAERILNINPIVQVKSYGDKIVIDPIEPGRVFINESNRPVFDYSDEKEELELTLTNGVFE